MTRRIGPTERTSSIVSQLEDGQLSAWRAPYSVARAPHPSHGRRVGVKQGPHTTPMMAAGKSSPQFLHGVHKLDLPVCQLNCYPHSTQLIPAG
jgi:hypothetical protein